MAPVDFQVVFTSHFKTILSAPGVSRLHRQATGLGIGLELGSASDFRVRVW